MINPYHIQPGLLLDVDITSIKRKKATLDAMANVLNEFLHGVSKGFQDAAFASFSRRRSTVREDINQSFADAQPEEPSAGAQAQAGGQAYLDMLNAGGEAAAAAIEAPKKAGSSRKAAAKAPASAKPKKSGGRAARKAAGGALKEI
jgi:hypothetical protein